MQTAIHVLITLLSFGIAVVSFRPLHAGFRTADRRRVMKEAAYVAAFERLNWFERMFWPVPIGTPTTNPFKVTFATLIASTAVATSICIVLSIKILGG